MSNETASASNQQVGFPLHRVLNRLARCVQRQGGRKAISNNKTLLFLRGTWRCHRCGRRFDSHGHVAFYRQEGTYRICPYHGKCTPLTQPDKPAWAAVTWGDHMLNYHFQSWAEEFLADQRREVVAKKGFRKPARFVRRQCVQLMNSWLQRT